MSVHSIEINEDLAELMPSFIKNTKKDLVDLNQALEAADYETASRLGHSMKGYGSGYGFDYLSELGKEIEVDAKDKKIDAVKKNITLLKSYVSEIEKAVAELKL